MSRLEGRVAIVTGAGQGLGRAHAMYLAEQGAAVVVNDLGATLAGEDVAGRSPAEAVVNEIRACGGRAVASNHDVSDWGQAADLIRLAVDSFGELHVLVNNAGIIRDRTIAKMTENEWDAVIRVHLKGHAAPTHHAMAYWATQASTDKGLKRSIVHTTSVAGFAGNFGQANYSAAKAGIAALSRVVALEGKRIGVRSNAVSPSARTRMTLAVPGPDNVFTTETEGFDRYNPANVSPLVGWLAEENCPANGQTFHCAANRILVLNMADIAHDLSAPGRWTAEQLDQVLPARLFEPTPVEQYLV